MGVSRLDSFTLASAQAATGYAPAANQYQAPVNAITSFLVSGNATGLVLSIETFDGTNWAPISGLSITANGAYTWQGAALGVRSNVTAIASGAVTVVAVFADMG